MTDPRSEIRRALATFDRSTIARDVAEGETERKQILERFPMASWPTLPLERYALGLEGSEDGFCAWLEFKAQNLGGMRGGSARKLLIYKHKDKPGWYFRKDYPNERVAWEKIRAAFVKAFELAARGEWEEIDELEDLRTGPSLRTKTMHVYFPDEILPIYARDHVSHFLRRLDHAELESDEYGVVPSRKLLRAVREIPEFEGWSNVEIMHFLYEWADPREEPRIVKIAPGENAKFWDDCLKQGYICVGWDDVGDLREFEDKEGFVESFFEHFLQRYKGSERKAREKANELWTLRELEAGDKIVANKGISRVLAVGTVVDPGYEWLPERPEFKHIVRVQWDTTVATDIPPERRWAFKTVGNLPPALWPLLRGAKMEAGKATVAIPRTTPADPILRTIEDAIERRGQAILFGPPGTGKTFIARRFATWWLRKKMGTADPGSVLGNAPEFAAAERALMVGRSANNVWWVVANPKEWAWDRLFADGSVSYRYGRLQRNYPRVQVGDLVVGYQATPDKRIVAVARISRALGVAEGEDEPTIGLAPVTRLQNGLSYDEIAAIPELAQCEPMRFGNRGTLFALSEPEADRLFSLLAERDPAASGHFERSDQGVPQLTYLTFHASYSYEDFVEGFRPVGHGAGGGISLQLEDGVFKRICRAASLNPKKPYLLLIDEINRGNVAKVFGELISLLEKDKRGMTVQLPQSREAFSIPPNLYVLGTMNTADRSIKLLDAAIRRRFSFVELMPDPSLLEGVQIDDLVLDDFLEELNRRIARREGREKQIGHSYLLDEGRPVREIAEFHRRFTQEILPLLQEYCYDDFDALAGYLGPRIVDREAHAIRPECLDTPEALVAALVREFTGATGSTE